jgi:protein required for attachment to host cells
MKPMTWIVVANQSGARIYTVDRARGPLIELHRLDHAAARRHEGDLISDRPGRAFDSVGPGRHSMEPAKDAKEHEAELFAKQVAERVESARVENRFSKLILVAAPYFLGLLRQKLSPAATGLVSHEIAKNLLQSGTEVVREHLPERL